MRYEYIKGQMRSGGICRYCPIHGAGGEVCGEWCAMFELESGEGGYKFAVCHAFKTRFMVVTEQPTKAKEAGL